MRLFVALQPPLSLHADMAKALDDLQRVKHKGVSWVAMENLHLTVNFIGEVAEHRVDALKNLIAAQASKLKAIRLKAEGITLFPSKYPRLIWVQLLSDEKDLYLLHRQLLSSMRQLGIDADAKKLKLHVTLGRIKAQQSPEFERSVLAYDFPSEELYWDTLILYRSTLRPEGPRYDIIEQYNLKYTEV
ncbi:MAG: RNA 2',3'-cyclic phosphodiesterase [Candidatus Cloacimonadaceae bacterium]|jgi:2'-5' RNA ligase|nr:RNA 2',3'-cyclic phosphodiesterase [Candidatus Cloacimonadota bacterium]MDY0127517.1 RNA 2',3'-cyclic phosphodiesterase [Candidatus Cloacimonadaceae bacterium]MCB5254718.1 RNA 2',3'-cyclic phosphodiesterase [Candidatus Cloacimonadota bacterium]MCK9177973.1 RNA 2',3'-cyclic phosphodiesterase [Candidatus Cloacimonadota bacterium]MCK9242375.1 RNA 2',3'-cyclic phosphodiesterase [Candidatus Cloacimonadota bacterium]